MLKLTCVCPASIVTLDGTLAMPGARFSKSMTKSETGAMGRVTLAVIVPAFSAALLGITRLSVLVLVVVKLLLKPSWPPVVIARACQVSALPTRMLPDHTPFTNTPVCGGEMTPAGVSESNALPSKSATTLFATSSAVSVTLCGVFTACGDEIVLQRR